jgi:hypothetical protein
MLLFRICKLTPASVVRLFAKHKPKVIYAVAFRRVFILQQLAIESAAFQGKFWIIFGSSMQRRSQYDRVNRRPSGTVGIIEPGRDGEARTQPVVSK